MRTVTALNAKVWLTASDASKMSSLETMSADDLLSVTGITNDKAKMADFGWVEVGTAAVTYLILDKGALAARAVSALRTKQEAILAKAHEESRIIEGAIQSLMALGYKPEDG